MAERIIEGITEEQMTQLLYYSQTDPGIERFTSDKGRFGSPEAYDAWLQKGRSIFTLTNEEGSLLGIVWLGEEVMPKRNFIRDFNAGDYGITFAIRIY